MDKKIAIIGSSIAGASSAYFLAENNDVTLIEEDDHFRKTCSGIVTHVIDSLIKIPNDILVNKSNVIRINSPNNNSIEVKLKEPDYIYNREKLNRFFTYKALDKGAKLIQPSRFTGSDGNNIMFKENDKLSSIEADYLIGADGSQSTVAKSFGLFGKREFFLGAKAYVEIDHDNAIDVFPHIGLFSWLVPHYDNIVEAGIFCNLKDASRFEMFLKQINPRKIISKEAALIPIYNPNIKIHKKTADLTIFLIGDAATMVKATTGGSIFQSIKSAMILAESIDNNRSYEKKVKKEVGRELWLHLKIREILNRFKSNDWENLIERFSNKKLLNILQEQSRDYPSKLLTNLIIKDPSLLLLSRFLF